MSSRSGRKRKGVATAITGAAGQAAVAQTPQSQTPKESKDQSLGPDQERTKEARGFYYAATSKFSEVCRQLALAGVAITWILHSPDKTVHLNDFDESLLLALLYMVAGLFLDALQYLYRSCAWGILARYRETRAKDENRNFPVWINLPTTVLFWLKGGAVLYGYLVLGSYIVPRL